MRPADFYLGGRQIFGFILPGLVWMSVLAMVLLGSHSLTSMLAGIAAFGATTWFIVLAGALVLGMLTQRAFIVAFLVARRISERRGKLPHQELFEEALGRLNDCYGVASATLPKAQHLDDKAKSWDARRSIFVACKRILVARKSPLTDYLTQLESEINVFGMLQLPVVVFFGCLVWRASEIPPMGYSWSVNGIRLVLIAALVVIEWLLVAGFIKSHADEQRDCLGHFLIQEAVDESLKARQDPETGVKPRGR